MNQGRVPEEKIAAWVKKRNNKLGNGVKVWKSTSHDILFCTNHNEKAQHYYFYVGSKPTKPVYIRTKKPTKDTVKNLSPGL